MDSENEETGSSLPRRARHQGGFGVLTEPFEKFKLNAFATFMADRNDSGGASMDDYFVVSGTAQYEAYEGIAPFIRVQNIFNRDYEEVPGFGTLGASIFAGIQVQL
jgi:vitamin B12 transporter